MHGAKLTWTKPESGLPRTAPVSKKLCFAFGGLSGRLSGRLSGSFGGSPKAKQEKKLPRNRPRKFPKMEMVLCTRPRIGPTGFQTGSDWHRQATPHVFPETLFWFRGRLRIVVFFSRRLCFCSADGSAEWFRFSKRLCFGSADGSAECFFFFPKALFWPRGRFC